MEKRTAVVTGAGAGLGFATATLLCEEGWEVYGSVSKRNSIEELEKLGVVVFALDIANHEETDAFAAFVEEKLGDRGLSALINVAGISGPGSGLLEGVSPENAKLTVDVNLHGTLNMVRSFLPLLRKYGPARIVNVSSGNLTPAPFTGVYLVSKFGVEGITNVLRYEMAPFGIQATSVEPAGMKTNMTKNAEERTKQTWDRMGEKVKNAYYDKINPSLEFMNRVIDSSDEPIEVAKVILKALNAKKMKIRYQAKSVAWQLPVWRLLGENAFESMMMKGMKLK